MSTNEQRLQIVAAARAEVEKYAAEPRDRLRSYFRSAANAEPPAPEAKAVHWCGIFCLAMLHAAGIASAVRWRFGGGFALEQHLPVVREPLPGDIAIFGPPMWHHAIVAEVEALNGHRTLITIDGNQGDPHHPRGGDVRVAARAFPGKAVFYSIAPLLEAAEAPAVVMAPAAAVSRPTLRKGASGAAVRELQLLLGNGLVADGSFGPRTEAAVREAQGRLGLRVDGVVGPLTWGALGGK
jgi:hypothetical protein